MKKHFFAILSRQGRRKKIKRRLLFDSLLALVPCHIFAFSRFLKSNKSGSKRHLAELRSPQTESGAKQKQSGEWSEAGKSNKWESPWYNLAPLYDTFCRKELKITF